MRVKERFLFLFFFSSPFLDLRKSQRRFSSGLKAKLIHAARAMRGHQNLGVSSNSTIQIFQFINKLRNDKTQNSLTLPCILDRNSFWFNEHS